MKKLPTDKIIVFYDGTCALCNKTVGVVLTHDDKDRFRFASLQSNLGQEVLKKHGINSEATDSILILNPGKAYFIKSDAVLEIAGNLGPKFEWMVVFKALPKKFRDIVYDFIAKNRYRWFGRQETCILPTAKQKEKFLDLDSV